MSGKTVYRFVTIILSPLCALEFLPISINAQNKSIGQKAYIPSKTTITLFGGE